MKSWMKLIIILICLAPIGALAQISPLPVDQNTVALWNFDTDVSDDVIDIGPSPLNGTAYTAEHLAIPSIDPAFNLARQFSSQSSFIDLGVVQGSKLDFTGYSELSIEAIIHLTQSARGDHIIFSSENVRLMVVNNQLAAFIRQPGGLFGVVSDRTLALNTTYRVGLHYKNKDLLLSVSGRVDSKIKLEYEIQNPQFSNSRASIGGDLFARYFPGYIDDVRVRNVVGIDIQGPGIELVEPTSFQVTTAKPNFLINLTDDDSGVDVSSIEVYLNGIRQPGISRTTTQISGTLDDELSTTVLNEVKIIVSDHQGNINEKFFFFSYASIYDRQEYTTDSNTLALWHMNDFAPGFMKDDSGHNRNGYGSVQNIQISDGVFGQGRQFIRGGVINFDSIRFDSLKFTHEAWYRPTSNYSSEEILFYNGQVKIYRWNDGYIRVVLYTTKGEKVYQSPDPLLPVNELHHLAVTWDGTKSYYNLMFFVDGMIRGQLDAVSECDFDPIPKLGLIGQNYEGMIDEMRFSDVVRPSFSIPISDNQVINFLNLKNGSSTNEAFPEFHATLNSASTINTSTVKIILNGTIEPVSPNLVVTATGIDGIFSQPLQAGLNHLEISFLDNNGNQRKKMQYFYYIKKDGGSEYSSNPDTAALWHFNEIQSGKFEDASGKGNDFVSLTLNPVSGVIGNGVKGSGTISEKMPLNCRSFTIESFVKSESNNIGFVNVYSISSSTSSHSLRLNPGNGNVSISISNSTNLNTEIPQAVPVDNAYHHIAVVYDGSRSYSQLLLIVDGVVKRALDFHNSCDYSGNNSYTVGYGDVFSFDEMRISKEAKYSFNLQPQVSDRPTITDVNIVDGATVHNSHLNYTFSLSDLDGINVGSTKIFLNGVEKTLTETNNLVSSFSSQLELNNGTNIIAVKSKDMLGNEQVFSQKVYLFQQGQSTEYAPDSDTVFLYHMNEATGPFVDSSASGIDLSDSGWSRTVGVFGGAASSYSVGGSYNYGNISATDGWTYEFWRKGGVSSSLTLLYGNGGTFSVTTTNWKLSLSLNGKNYIQTKDTGNDTEWHHYAIVVDPNHPLENVYFLVDGNVVYSAKESSDLSISNLSAGPAYTIYSAEMDELRFSRTPRYELVSTKE